MNTGASDAVKQQSEVVNEDFNDLKTELFIRGRLQTGKGEKPLTDGTKQM